MNLGFKTFSKNDRKVSFRSPQSWHSNTRSVIFLEMWSLRRIRPWATDIFLPCRSFISTVLKESFYTTSRVVITFLKESKLNFSFFLFVKVNVYCCNQGLHINSENCSWTTQSKLNHLKPIMLKGNAVTLSLRTSNTS